MRWRIGPEIEGCQQGRAGGISVAHAGPSPPGRPVASSQVGTQLVGQRRVIGQQFLGVRGPAGLDAREIGIEDTHDLGIIVRRRAGGRSEVTSDWCS